MVIHSLADTVFISEQLLQLCQCIWQMFLFKAYSNFKGVHAPIHLSGTAIISGSILQGISISRVLSFLEISTCNRLCFQRYSVNLPPVSEQEQLLQGYVIFINFDTSLVSGVYKLKDSLLFDDIISSHPFLLWYCHYLTGALEAIHYVKGTVFILQHLLQASITVSSLVVLRKFEGYCAYLRKAIVALLL